MNCPLRRLLTASDGLASLRAMADITTIAELGTAGGTLILAVATFGSVRSANRAARVAERSLELGLRPLHDPWADVH